ARRLASRPAREAQPEGTEEPLSRPARAVRAFVTWGPLWLVFAAAFLATWAGGVTLADRAGWVEVPMLPGWSETIAYNPAISLPLCMEVLLGVAIHRALSVTKRSHKVASSLIAVLAVALAATVQIEAHGTGDVSEWIKDLAAVLPVIALALVAILGAMRPARKG